MTDTWAAAGLHATVKNGAVLTYAPGNVLLNPGDPFVTCVSNPLKREDLSRFNAAAAAVAGRYDTPGPNVIAEAGEVNVAWFASPPATTLSPSVDGYIARIVIDISGVVGIDPATITVTTGPLPARSIALLISQHTEDGKGMVGTTFDVPQFSGIDWTVYALPPAPDPTVVFRYSFADGTPLPAIPDQGPQANDATAGPSATLSAVIPPIHPVSAGNRSLDCRVNGAVTNANILLSNAAIGRAGGFTMETWFNWNGEGSVNSILDYAGTEKLVIGEFLRRPVVIMRFNDETEFPVGRVVPGRWHYVAVVFEVTGANPDRSLTGNLTTYFDELTPSSTNLDVTKSRFGDSLARGIGVGQHPLGQAPDFLDGLIYEPRVSLGPLRPSQLLLAESSAEGAFLRCDSNCSGGVDISDCVNTLNFLFLGDAAPCCTDAGNCNGDGVLDISDATYGLNFLFVGGPPPPTPFPSCGGNWCQQHPCS